MVTKTPNLGLDVGLVGGGEQLRQSLANNFKNSTRLRLQFCRRSVPPTTEKC